MVEGILEPVRKFRRSQHAFAPDIHDMQHLLVAYRANLNACVARRTRPRRLFAKRKIEQRPRTLFTRRETWESAVQLQAFIDENRRRAERLARISRRAYILTAITHDAAIRIQQARPSEFLQLRGTESFFIFKIHRLQHSRSFFPEREVDRSHE